MVQVLLVTGGGRGIGAETCLRAARDGWDICVNYRGDAARAEEIVSQVEAAGQKAIAVQGDIADEDDVIRMFETCDREIGTLTGLVNSAGILKPLSRIDEIDGPGLTNHMMINVVGSILCAREAVRRMSTSHGGVGGVIVDLSSRTSELGGAGASVVGVGSQWIMRLSRQGQRSSGNVGQCPASRAVFKPDVRHPVVLASSSSPMRRRHPATGYLLHHP